MFDDSWLQRGDVLLQINGRSLLDLTHTDAVGVLKASAEGRTVTLKVLEGPESCDGVSNFTPSWKFWLAMPVYVLKFVCRYSLAARGFL